MEAKLVFMFAGQGAQYFQMGEELYRSNPVFRREMRALDGIATDILGRSVINTLYGATKRFERPFDQILLTHPALFMVQYSLAKSLMEEGIEPDYVLGASLGEWVSVAVAGMLDPGDALEILIKKATLFDQKCFPGGLLAVLSNRALFDEQRDLFSGCEFAALNFPNHFCVAGDTHSIDVSERNIRRSQITCEQLPLKRPFHCSLVEPLYDEFVGIFADVRFADSRLTLVSSASARPVLRVTKEHFWNVVRQPIEFYSAIQHLSADPDLIYVDLSPSGTLANFVGYGLPPERYRAIYRIMTRMGRDVAHYEQFKTDFEQRSFSRSRATLRL